jgi:hypothetical protein
MMEYYDDLGQYRPKEPNNWGHYHFHYAFLMFDYDTVGIFSGGASDSAYTVIVGEEKLATLPDDIATNLRAIAATYSNHTLCCRDPRLKRRDGGTFWAEADHRMTKLAKLLHVETEIEAKMIENGRFE